MPTRHPLRTLLIAAACFAPALAASAQTPVCGPINASTSWTLANSPYQLTCDVVLLSGAVLTIDPGVVVQFNPGVRLVSDNGYLIAVGLPGQPIKFISAIPSNIGRGVEVGPTTNGQARFDHCEFESLQLALYLSGSHTINGPISNCVFKNNQSGAVRGSGPQISFTSCAFNNNLYGLQAGNSTLTNCTFNGNTTGASPGQSTALINCSFTNNTLVGVGGFMSTNSRLDGCTLTGNNIAVQGVGEVRRCTITGNQIGLDILFQNTIVVCNDIFANTLYDARCTSNNFTNLNIGNNWWGTTTTSAIDTKILDGFDLPNNAFLDYNPILTSSHTTTGACQCTPPVVTFSPFTTFSGPGGAAAFPITVTGTPPLTYQWFKNGVPITPGPRFSGLNSPTLLISPIANPGSEPGWTDAGNYSCIVSNLCGSASSTPTPLVVPVCRPDYNINGFIDVQDIFNFLSDWFAGC